MKDSIKEFENLNNRINKLFEGLGWMNPSNWFSDNSQTNKIKDSYKRGSALTDYLSKIESGECEYGVSNNRFSSEPGKNDAYFYDESGEVTGYVKNIKPFLSKAGITKQNLRCYNLDKDKLNISWLFDGKFNAEILSWDTKKRKIIFNGKWNGGLYNGITYVNPDYKPSIEKQKYKYYILNKGKEVGPYTSDQIVKAVNKGVISTESIIRPENSTDYQQIKDNALLAILFKSVKTTKSSVVKKPITKPSIVKKPKGKP